MLKLNSILLGFSLLLSTSLKAEKVNHSQIVVDAWKEYQVNAASLLKEANAAGLIKFSQDKKVRDLLAELAASYVLNNEKVEFEGETHSLTQAEINNLTLIVQGYQLKDIDILKAYEGAKKQLNGTTGFASNPDKELNFVGKILATRSDMKKYEARNDKRVCIFNIAASFEESYTKFKLEMPKFAENITNSDTAKSTTRADIIKELYNPNERYVMATCYKPKSDEISELQYLEMEANANSKK